MVTKLVTWVACGLLVCGPQEFRDWIDAPMAIDPNRIALDPASGQRLCLGWAVVERGRTYTRTATYCDPDGDAMAFAPAAYLTVDAAAGTYTITATPAEVGVTYYEVSVTDVPGPDRTAKTRTGTFVLACVPANRPPVLGCAAVR